MDTLLITRPFFLIVLLLTTLSSFSCTSKTNLNKYSYIGLYEITERQCNVPDNALDECTNTKFIELVKGQFYGIKNNETAIVMWRGNKGEELLYQARKIEQLSTEKQLSDKIIISNTETDDERLNIVNGLVSEYSLKINKKSASDTKPTEIKYSLRPVKRGLLPEYRMNYPGND